ncbi:MAG: Ig-like domain-containing protein [Gemmatimonadota bacterium]|nr:Ig-like domain-containing protein [Gemmatimonadota bacterium]
MAILLGALGAGLGACASEGFPPGGPVDNAPPVLVESDPADRSVKAQPDQAIRLVFDEVLDPRQLRRIDDLILVNPDTPDFDISMDDERIVLAPTGAMIDGITYMVTVLPGLADRNGNATTEPRTILFSVGGETRITLSLVRARIVRDSVPAVGARYLLENTETEFAYRMVADSQGQVEMEAVAYGPYVATAWQELSRPEGWQITEEPGARDTFVLGPGRRAHDATYRISVRDTTPPLVEVVETIDSRRIRVEVDDRLVGEAAPPPSEIRLWVGPSTEEVGPEVRPDSIPLDRQRVRSVPVAEVERAGPSSLEVVAAVPLDRDRWHRVELVGVENVDRLAATPAGGLAFRPRYPGPAVWPSEPVPWPEWTPEP